MNDVEAVAQDVGHLIVVLGDRRLLQVDQVGLELADAVDQDTAAIRPSGTVGKNVVRPEPDVGFASCVPSGDG